MDSRARSVFTVDAAQYGLPSVFLGLVLNGVVPEHRANVGAFTAGLSGHPPPRTTLEGTL
ncbi:hypothetical protein Lfu02_17500 [Longispora fulva]|nr:hypothetical protein Lfu02_17500 [Longispora fulva]